MTNQQPMSPSMKSFLIVLLVVFVVVPIGFFILAFAFLAFFFNVDNIHHAAYEPVTTDYLIEYIHEEILRETGDDVELEIISKEPIAGCVHMLDACGRYKEIADTYKYQLRATNKDNPKVQVIVDFSDSYITDDYITQRRLDYDDYRTLSIKTKIKDELIATLGDTEYNITERENQKVGGYTTSSDNTVATIEVDILSEDYDMLDTLFTNIHSINQEFNSDHTIAFRAYVFRDGLYGNLIQVNGADISTIKNANGYSRSIMETPNPGGYDSIWFVYSNSCHYPSDPYTNVECSSLKGYQDGISLRN